MRYLAPVHLPLRIAHSGTFGLVPDPHSALVYRQSKLSLFWPGCKPSASVGESSSSPSSSRPPSKRKRLRGQMAAAAVAESAARLVWRVDGRHVPVAPPPWEGQSSQAELCAQVTAHNSYVSAVAAERAAEAMMEAAHAMSGPPPKRRKSQAIPEPSPRSSTRGRKGASAAKSTGALLSASAAAVAEAEVHDHEAAPLDDYAAANPAVVMESPSRRSLPRASKSKSSPVGGVSLGLVKKLRSALIKKMHADLISPPTNDAAFLARSEHAAFLRGVVMEAAGVGPAAADRLLATVCEVPTKNLAPPSTKVLKPWLAKTMNNTHFSLRKCVSSAWARAVQYDGTRRQAKRFLEGRGYLKGPTGRRGIVAAFLATLTLCGADPEKYTFPDGPDGDALFDTVLVTLAFVFSKVRQQEGLCVRLVLMCL